MANVTIKQLLEAGVHFGHQTRRWNPKMAEYIFGDRNGIHIINLEKTLLCLEDACSFIEEIADEGKEVLFVGTKRQAQAIMSDAADRAEMPYVVNRWLGGMLTNFETVSKSIVRMKTITDMEESGALSVYTKKEANGMLKDRDKMEKNLGGIKNMKRMPGAVFIVDSCREGIALREARKLNIPIIALVDTNADPEMIDFPIPGNDDALRSITLISDTISKAVIEGKKVLGARKAAEAKKAAEEAAAKAEKKEAEAKKDAVEEKAE